MKLSQFDFKLASTRTAIHPSENRDESRLMVVHKKTGKIEHKQFKDIIKYFKEDDVLVLNDTRVFPARLYGQKEKTGAKIEVFLLRELNPELNLWDVLVDPARKIRVGNKLYFGDGELVAEVIDNTTSRGRTIRFIPEDSEKNFYDIIHELGETPLPKEIKRKVDKKDEKRFQTVYAKKIGAVSAPAAGLHFTEILLKKLELKGVKIVNITSHTGLGTFKDIDVEDLTKHKMDSENYSVPIDTEIAVNNALKNNNRIFAVGTSSMKTLETAVNANDTLKANSGWTDKFIFPPYEFKICSGMITNFHSPKSTLLMMATAYGGFDTIMKAYKVAIKEKYMFHTYGDALLII
jgi:S-adenosylmethionine:tRNA ribosyltransferase-isomerase